MELIRLLLECIPLCFLIYEGQGEDKESGNADCILLSHLEINEATHKRGGARERREERVSLGVLCGGRDERLVWKKQQETLAPSTRQT